MVTSDTATSVGSGFVGPHVFSVKNPTSVSMMLCIHIGNNTPLLAGRRRGRLVVCEAILNSSPFPYICIFFS